MDKQTFGEDESAQGQLREQPVEPPIEVNVALREEDVVEVWLVCRRVPETPLIGLVMLSTAGLALLLVSRGFALAYAVLMVLFGVAWAGFRYQTVRRAKRIYRKDADSALPSLWSFTADEVLCCQPMWESRLRWEMYTSLCETPNVFVLYAGRGAHLLPKRGFADAAEMERFRELVREKGLEIKVVGANR